MSVNSLITIVQNAVFQVLIMAAPILLIGMGVGLVVSIFQATTSIQEQTLTFVPKIAAILLAIVFFGPWMLNSMKQYTINLFNLIPEIVK